MKIFIAWSKGVSKEIGLELNEWLPKLHSAVFSTVISEEAIEIGSVWHNSLDEALKSADFGILCVTEENLNSPWLCYESGALSMSTAQNNIKDGHPNVAPIRFGNVSASQIANPIQRFQSIPFNKDKMLKLALRLNAYSRSVNPNPQNFLDEKDITQNFERTYPALEKKVHDILRERIPAAVTERRAELTDELDKIWERLRRLESLNVARTDDAPADKMRPFALDEFDAALTEFRRYESAGTAFKTLSVMGDFLSVSIRKESLTESVRRKAQQYRELLRRSRDMTETPVQSLALQRLLNSLSAFL